MNIVAAPLRDEEGRLTGVSCYAGHFTSQAMSAPPDDIPVLGERVAGVGSALHFAPGGHAAKALVHVIDRFHELKGIDLEIPEKQVTALIGPSGCGKSTLLRVFNRISALYPKPVASGARKSVVMGKR